MKEKLGRAVVGIAGLGGLGSNVAVALARTNVGKLIIADFDKVEESNLNRQQYFVDQLGRGKVEAMTENLRRINPNVKIEGHQLKLTADNVPKIFGDADVVAECFDKAQELDADWLVPLEAARVELYYGKPSKALGRIRRAVVRRLLCGHVRRFLDRLFGTRSRRAAFLVHHPARGHRQHGRDVFRDVRDLLRVPYARELAPANHLHPDLRARRARVVPRRRGLLDDAD